MRNIAGDKRLAYSLDQDEGQLASPDLFVLPHKAEQLASIRFDAWDIADPGWQANGFEVGGSALRLALRH